MKYQFWKCTICNEEFRTSTEMGWFTVRDHLATHKTEWKTREDSEAAYNSNLIILDKRYEKKDLGFWIKNITPPSKPRKLWKCKNCGDEMGYHHKYYHLQNNKPCEKCGKEISNRDMREHKTNCSQKEKA